MGSQPGGTDLQQIICIQVAEMLLVAFSPRATASPKENIYK